MLRRSPPIIPRVNQLPDPVEAINYHAETALWAVARDCKSILRRELGRELSGAEDECVGNAIRRAFEVGKQTQKALLAPTFPVVQRMVSFTIPPNCPECGTRMVESEKGFVCIWINCLGFIPKETSIDRTAEPNLRD